MARMQQAIPVGAHPGGAAQLASLALAVRSSCKTGQRLSVGADKADRDRRRLRLLPPYLPWNSNSLLTDSPPAGAFLHETAPHGLQDA